MAADHPLRRGNTKRPLYAFVMVLSWSRALHAVFTLDQTSESFLRGHVEAFSFFQGVPRQVAYDNLKSAVLERRGSAIHFLIPSAPTSPSLKRWRRNSHA